jgi:hypothetical protein
MSDDPLHNIISRITIVVIVAILITLILKPFITIAADLMNCLNCDPDSAIILTSLILFGAIGISMYKLMRIFYGDDVNHA